MPKVTSLSDFNRNQTAIIDELHETEAPIYLTRNGSASVVVMDAEAFDKCMSFRSSIASNEMRVYNKLLEGYFDYQQGNMVSATEAEANLLASKGW